MSGRRTKALRRAFAKTGLPMRARFERVETPPDQVDIEVKIALTRAWRSLPFEVKLIETGYWRAFKRAWRERGARGALRCM